MNPRFPTSGDDKSKAKRIGKAAWAEIMPHFRERGETISALLFRRDPLKLSFGSNRNEYDEAAWAILSQLIICQSRKGALAAVHQGFCLAFGAEKTGPVADYKNVANEIWRVWRRPP